MQVVLPLPVFALMIGVIALIVLLLPRYSRDGDLAEKHSKNQYEIDSFTTDQSWDRLRVLASVNSAEVTWIHSLSVSFVLALTYVGLLVLVSPTTPSTILLFFSALIAFTVAFAMQDGVVRWKKAHRYNPTEEEAVQLMTKLRHATTK